MPIYPYICRTCNKTEEIVRSMEHTPPTCCGRPMERHYTEANIKIKEYGALWIDRMDDIHKEQSDRGERLRLVQPWEVL